MLQLNFSKLLYNLNSTKIYKLNENLIINNSYAIAKTAHNKNIIAFNIKQIRYHDELLQNTKKMMVVPSYKKTYKEEYNNKLLNLLSNQKEKKLGIVYTKSLVSLVGVIGIGRPTLKIKREKLNTQVLFAFKNAKKALYSKVAATKINEIKNTFKKRTPSYINVKHETPRKKQN